MGNHFQNFKNGEYTWIFSGIIVEVIIITCLLMFGIKKGIIFKAEKDEKKTKYRIERDSTN